jgi:hypothetical protein
MSQPTSNLTALDDNQLETSLKAAISQQTETPQQGVELTEEIVCILTEQLRRQARVKLSAEAEVACFVYQPELFGLELPDECAANSGVILFAYLDQNGVRAPAGEDYDDNVLFVGMPQIAELFDSVTPFGDGGANEGLLKLSA